MLRTKEIAEGIIDSSNTVYYIPIPYIIQNIMALNTVIFTLRDISNLISITGDPIQDGISTVCDVGRFHTITLQERKLLIIDFEYAEIRLELSLYEIYQLRDEIGSHIFRVDHNEGYYTT